MFNPASLSYVAVTGHEPPKDDALTESERDEIMKRFTEATKLNFADACGILNVAYWDYDVAMKIFETQTKPQLAPSSGNAFAEQFKTRLSPEQLKSLTAGVDTSTAPPEFMAGLIDAFMDTVDALQWVQDEERQSPKPVPQTEEAKDAMVRELVGAYNYPVEAADARRHLEAAGWQYYAAERELTRENMKKAC